MLSRAEEISWIKERKHIEAKKQNETWVIMLSKFGQNNLPFQLCGESYPQLQEYFFFLQDTMQENTKSLKIWNSIGMIIIIAKSCLNPKKKSGEIFLFMLMVKRPNWFRQERKSFIDFFTKNFKRVFDESSEYIVLPAR